MMKKSILHIGLTVLVLAFASCQRLEMADSSLDRAAKDGDKVTFDMTFSLPETDCATKALGSAAPATLRNIYVAVFGSNHYLNEFIKAIPYKIEGGVNVVSVDGSGNLLYEADGSGNYRVRITLTESSNPRYVHILANVDESQFPDFNEYESDVMLDRLVAADGDGYWQYFSMPDGIDDTQKESFQNISLIRNFAWVDVTLSSSMSSDGWTVDAFSVYNTPTIGLFPIAKGSSVVSGTKTYTYDENYISKTFSGAVSQAKKLVKDADYCNRIINRFGAAPGASLPDDNADSKFVFENPMNDEEHSAFIIVKLTKTGSGARTKYFRLDFRSPEAELLPLLRNYHYTLNIGGIGIDGFDSPADAALYPSSHDIFSDLDVSQIIKLDNGISSLQVEYLEKVFTEAHTDVSFEYLYLAAANNTSSDGNVEASLPEGDAIYVAPANETDWKTGGSTVGATHTGWRKMSYNVNEPPSSGQKESTFRIFKQDDVTHTLLQQTIKVISMRKLAFDSSLTENPSTGVYTLSFTLPDNLPKGMFPLIFEFRQEDNKISPYGAGTSVVVGTDGVFRFTMELTYDNYLSNKVVNFQFISVKTINAGDKLVFGNQSSTSYDKYFVDKEYDLKNLGIVGALAEEVNSTPSPLPLGIGQEATISFKYLAGVAEPVTVTLHGLLPADGETRLTPTGTPGAYTYTPSSGVGEYSFNVKSTTRFSECSVVLSKSGSAYPAVSSGAISRPSSFDVPAGTLRATGNRPANNRYWVDAYTTSTMDTYVDAESYETRFTTTGYYTSRDKITVDLTRYGANVESGSVYFHYRNYAAGHLIPQSHYASVTLADLFDNIGSGVTLNFTNIAP